MTFGALSGFTVVVTAEHRAGEQVDLLERRGASVVPVPLVHSVPVSADVCSAAVAALVTRAPDLLVVCTGRAMCEWWEAVERLGRLDELQVALRGAHVMVPGPKAAAAAHAAGVDVGWTAPDGTYAQVAHRLTSQSSHDGGGRVLRVAVVLDGAGSEPVVDAARRHGFEVVEVPVHRGEMPVDTASAHRLTAAVSKGAVDAVTFTSARAVENFFTLASDAGVQAEAVEAFNRGAVSVAAVGPVTGARLRAFGVRFGLEPRTPSLGAMVQELALSFAGRNESLQLGGHPVTIQGRLVSVDGEELAVLTDRERAVLEVLAARRGGVVSKRALMTEVWGEAGDEHVVEVTVARLRRRLGRAGQSIETVVRRGYRLAVDAPPAEVGASPPATVLSTGG